MKRITDLTILQEFNNGDYGLYWCKFKGAYKLFTKNGNTFKVLTHCVGHDELAFITSSVEEELIKEIEAAR